VGAPSFTGASPHTFFAGTVLFRHRHYLCLALPSRAYLLPSLAPHGPP
jgi:hypothetical protein